MITIQNNTDLNFTQVRAIAREVWPIAYGNILSHEQLEYMMVMMYSVSSLREQFENGHHFILAMEEEIPVGFASYEFNCNHVPKTKIHKLYVLSGQQGKGIGGVLVDYITETARKNNQQALLLNVNKYNSARHFYEKSGFSVVEDVVIDIGNGYVMDDFVMEKLI